MRKSDTRQQKLSFDKQRQTQHQEPLDVMEANAQEGGATDTSITAAMIMMELHNGFKAMDARFDTMAGRLDRMGERLGKQDARLKPVEAVSLRQKTPFRHYPTELRSWNCAHKQWLSSTRT
ncbi:hypothetical protein NDU88_001822 [Pleurodeles waltl]|uniref:Uncharacterized protein n=1 Tax=Pleurodeles waltl TaxID=8319 RepID=A0AAV7TKT3_PLEWA|nr:hypothetical protein NDU88_001822 [Pleurodeles waltl]